MFDAPEPVPARSPFAGSTDPVAYAASHQTEVEWAGAAAADRGSGGSGSHRRRRPSRYILPAVVGALVVLAIGIGIAGWIRGSTPQTAATSPTLSQPSLPTAAQSSPVAHTSSAPASTHAASPSTPAAVSHSAKPPASTVPVPVTVFAPAIVLNETTTRGLAAHVAAELRTKGWTVSGVGNWMGNVPTTTVYYSPGLLAAAESLARELGVSRVRPAPRGMLSHHVTVVLTSNPFS